MHVQSIHFKDLELHLKDGRWAYASGSFVTSYYIDATEEGAERIKINAYSNLITEIRWLNRKGNVRKTESICGGDAGLLEEIADACWIGYIKGIINDGVE